MNNLTEKTRKYTYSVYYDVIDFMKENYDETITEEDVDRMHRVEVLNYWLLYNGIRGYTKRILDILDIQTFLSILDY